MNEYGYVVCKNGKLVKSKTTIGTPTSVSVPVSFSCPAGSKPRAIFHTHPSGSLQPSAQDMKAAQQHNLPICIRGGKKIKCYRPNKGA